MAYMYNKHLQLHQLCYAASTGLYWKIYRTASTGFILLGVILVTLRVNNIECYTGGCTPSINILHRVILQQLYWGLYSIAKHTALVVLQQQASCAAPRAHARDNKSWLHLLTTQSVIIFFPFSLTEEGVVLPPPRPSHPPTAETPEPTKLDTPDGPDGPASNGSPVPMRPVRKKIKRSAPPPPPAYTGTRLLAKSATVSNDVSSNRNLCDNACVVHTLN